ncbi:MAG TPA: prepilin-type N-terminal cleavage/methylation domain-containing protein [bacterium]|nr:prepilin-type N-terminal cleavage/methylation domain-containing protein [bacterium]
MYMRKKGFTLIELSAVAAIVSALSVGTYHAVQKGKSSQCLNNLKQIYQAVSMFTMDNGVLPNAKFFPSSRSDAKGIHNILAQYGARGEILFCPSIPAQLNNYGTNYIWNDALNNSSPDSVPASTWLMTEMTSVSRNIPAPHTGAGFNILYAGGNAQAGPRVNFPDVPSLPGKKPVQTTDKTDEIVPHQTFPRMIISSAGEVRAGEKIKIEVSIMDPAGKPVALKDTSLEIITEAEMAEIPSPLKIQESRQVADFESVFYKAGRITLKISEARTSIIGIKEIQVLPGEPFAMEFLNFPQTWQSAKPQKVTIVCYDKWKNKCDYTGLFYITDKTLQLPLKPMDMIKGQWSGELVFNKAHEQNILYAAAGKTISSSPEFNILHAEPAILEIKSAGETSAGASCEITAEIKDSFGNICTDFKGDIEIILPEGAVSDSKTVSFNSDDKGRKSFKLTFFSAGERIVKLSMENLKTEKEIYVNPGPLNEYKIREITTQEAGKPFDIVVRATDKWGNQIKGFSLRDSSGTVKYVSRDFTAGLWMETVIITKAGPQAIHIEDSYGIKGKSNTFTVLASNPDKMELEAIPLLLDEKNRYTAKIITRDIFGNEIGDYKGDFLIKSSEGLKTSLTEKMPPELIIEPMKTGYHTLNISDRKTNLKIEKSFFVRAKE